MHWLVLNAVKKKKKLELGLGLSLECIDILAVMGC